MAGCSSTAEQSDPQMAGATNSAGSGFPIGASGTCQPNRIGSNDYFSAPVLSPDGLHCCWDKIIMRAER